MRRWRGPTLASGKARARYADPERFDADQLAIGVKIETEHTSRPEVAMEIAMAHLLERPDYYARLERFVERDLARSRTEEVAEIRRFLERGGRSGKAALQLYMRGIRIDTLRTMKPHEISRLLYGQYS
jgi:hypothetical protein